MQPARSGPDRGQGLVLSGGLVPGIAAQPARLFVKQHRLNAGLLLFPERIIAVGIKTHGLT